ncbi:MAG: hypothetical protein JO034_22425, partial [Singulisphaera sp.]|nr:hypothetical protein [Singulisphaera sp.]
MGTFERISPEELTCQGVPHREALDLLRGLDAASAIADAPGRWSYLSRHALRPHRPASVHESLFRETYRDWDPRHGPAPAWIPPDDIR